MIQTIDTNGAQVNIGYDALGRVQSRTNPFPQGGTPAPATTYQYDVLGRLKVTTLPDGNTVQQSYSGSSVTITDQVNRKTKREGDGLGRLVKVIEQDVTGALAQETNYVYDIADRLIQVNQGGQLRSFKYDSAGQLLFEKIPEQTATINDGTGTFWTCKYTYTDFGAVATKTDARGVVTTYGYDSLNRLTSVSYDLTNAPNVQPTNNISYTFDNSATSPTKGLLLSISMTGPLPTYQDTFSYDSQKRPSSRTWTRDGRSYTIGYQYNTANQLTQLTYPSGRVVAMGRDNKGRVTSVGSFLTSVSYNGIGQVTTFGDLRFRIGLNLGNGVSETYGYDSQRLQLTSQTATKSGNTLMSLSYNFQALAGQMGPGTSAGNAGQLMSISGTIDGTTESASYTYDLLRRITTSSQTTNGVSAQRRFAYDRWGNRTGVWDAVTGGNQLQSVALQQSGGAPTNRITSVTSGATVNYSYDSAGNVTSDGSHSYSFDGENRMFSVDSGTTGSYRFDHKNRRVKKTTGTAVTHYVWEGSRVIAEYDQTTGALLTEYIYGRGRMLAKIEGGATRYHLRDRLSNRLIVDSNGSAVGRRSHLPFGEELGASGEQEKHRFTLYEGDAESGNDYAKNRHYSSGIARFQQADPYRPSGRLVDPQSWNRYAYTRNDSINRNDPAGLEDLTLHSCPAGYTYDKESGDCGLILKGESEGGDSGGGDYEDTLRDFGFGDPDSPGVGDEAGDEPSEPGGQEYVITTDPYFDTITRVAASAIRRLQDRPDCRRLLSGFFGDPAKALEELWKERRIRSGDARGTIALYIARSAGFFGYSKADEIILDVGGFFTDKTVGNWVGFNGLKRFEAQELILLHEIGHRTSLSSRHSEDAIDSEKYNAEIYNACFK